MQKQKMITLAMSATERTVVDIIVYPCCKYIYANPDDIFIGCYSISAHTEKDPSRNPDNDYISANLDPKRYSKMRKLITFFQYINICSVLIGFVKAKSVE
jgi:hypothetical protein